MKNAYKLILLLLISFSCERPAVEPTSKEKDQKLKEVLHNLEKKAKIRRNTENLRLTPPTNHYNPYDSIVFERFQFINAINEDANFLANLDTTGGPNVYKYKIVKEVYDAAVGQSISMDTSIINEEFSKIDVTAEFTFNDLTSSISSHPGFTDPVADIWESYFSATNSLRASIANIDSANALIDIALQYETDIAEIADELMLSNAEKEFIFLC